MTKKDYVAIARIIARWRKSAEIVAQDWHTAPAKDYASSVLAAVTCDLADLFAKGNPRFDAGKFHDACRSMMGGE